MKFISKFTFSRLVLVVIAVVFLFAFSLAQSTYTYENFPYGNWVLVGFPVTPEDQSPDAVWGPFFGGNQGNDNDATNDLWRFSRWDVEHDTYIRWGELDRDTNNVYSDLGEPTDIVPGWGYWFYQNQDEGVTFTSNGTKADDSQPYLIAIDPPQDGHRGKTMVANPFDFSIDWKNTEIIAHSDDLGIDTILTLLEANEMGLLDQHAYPWNMGLINGSTGEYISYDATNGGELPLWQGFWVEQLNEDIKYYVSYKIEHNHSDTDIKYHDAYIGHISNSERLGEDGLRETDRFVVVVENAPNEVGVASISNNQVDAYISAANPNFLNNDGAYFEWISAVTDGDNTTFTIDVTAEVDDPNFHNWIDQIRFDFGEDATVLLPGAPQQGGTHGGNEGDDPVGNGARGTTTVLRSTYDEFSQASNFALQLKVYPTEYSSAKKSSSGYSPYSVIQTVEEREWIMPLSIVNRDGNVHDNYNAIGILNSASDGYDVNDVTQQNPPGAYLEIYFPHNDKSDLFNYWFERPVSVSYDMRSDSAHKEWKMVVGAYEVANQQSTINWNATSVNSDWTLRLYDDDFNVLIDDMKTVSEYTFTTQNLSYSTEVFYIQAIFISAITGIQSESLPKVYRLLDNYPNPFNASTNIRFGIDRKMWVKVDIYSLKGEKIRTLVNDLKSPGTYLVNWDGTDVFNQTVPSGVYLCRVISDDFSKTHKLLLLK